jgi:ribosomal protein S18 acetylase RimI-like enzyme
MTALAPKVSDLGGLRCTFSGFGRPDIDMAQGPPGSARCSAEPVRRLPVRLGMLGGVDIELPAGYTWRRPSVDDAEEIWEFVAGRNTSIIGFADVTLDDIRDELEEPEFDPSTDGWIVHDRAGKVAGYAWACRKSDSDEVDIDTVAEVAAVGDWLWAATVARAREIGAELGHAEVALDVGIYRADEAQQARARADGFAVGTTFHRMRIDHHGVPVEPDASGVTIRTGETDEQVRRDALGIANAASKGQFGFVEQTFDEWHRDIEATTTHDWAQLRVVYLDDQPVAMLHGSDQFAEDERCGYVARVAVLETARGRGLAKLLLHQAFARDARAGRVGTILHVDTNNPTPALGLYERVGMRPVLVIDVWRRIVSTTDR